MAPNKSPDSYFMQHINRDAYLLLLIKIQTYKRIPPYKNGLFNISYWAGVMMILRNSIGP